MKAYVKTFLYCLTSMSVVHAASDVNISTAATSGGSFSGSNPNIFSPTAPAAVANNGIIQTSLNGGSAVTVNTASGAGGDGDITLTSPLSKTAGASSILTLTAVRDIAINAAVSSSTGAFPLVLNAGRNISSTQALTSNGGNITLSPGQVFSLGAAMNAGAGQVALQTGSLESTSAYTVTGSSIQVAAAAALRLNGTVAGPLTMAGIVSPKAGSDTGSLQVNGSMTLQGTATTVIDLGGTSQGSTYDRINVTGAVTVAGALQVNLVNNFHDTISGSSTFSVIQGSSISGTFAGYPNGSRFTLANDYGSLRVNYTATSVTLDDWQPVIVNLTWDPGTVDAGMQIFSNTNTRAGRHYFRVLTQSTDVGAWRSRLTLISGDAALYMRKTTLPTVGSSSFSSAQVGSDGFVLRDDQFAAGEEWYILVNATAGAQWSLFSGRAFVNDLGPLPFTDANGNSQYDIGEAVTPQTAPAIAMPPEGIRFYQSTIPVGTPAWSLWLNGSTREIAVRTSKVPFHSSTSYYTRKQVGQMLVVPTVLGTGSNAYFMSVVAPQGEVVGLDSRIQTVTDIGFQSTTSNVAVTGAPYRVFRTQVPIDQLAWDVSTTAVAGNPNVCVRKNNVPGEWDNDALSEAIGSTTDSVTLVPDFLTNGTWFITVYGTGSYTFTLKSGDPVITPMSYTDLKVNDQTNRAGWRFYALTDIPSQVGSLGWELQLANQVPGSQIAIRRNKVPSRWLYRTNGSQGSPGDTSTSYMDYYGNGGFLQRPGHQADVWYVGVYTPQAPLGAFSLDAHPLAAPTVGFDGGTSAATGLEPGRWKFQRIDVPAGILGWDLRLRDVSGAAVPHIGVPQMVVRRDLLPDSALNSGSWLYSGVPSAKTGWLSGNQWAAGSGESADWTGLRYDIGAPTYLVAPARLLMGMGRPLEAGTYYVGVFNNSTTTASSYTIDSRGIGEQGSGWSYEVQPSLAYVGGTATISNLAPREAKYFKVTIPANTPSWEVTLEPTAGEMELLVRRGTVPDFNAGGSGEVNNENSGQPSGDVQIEMQKAGAERYVMLPQNGQAYIPAADYYLAVVSEGVNPVNSTIGTGASSGVLTSLGPLAVTPLGSATNEGLMQAVSLEAGQIKAFTFTVPANTNSLEVRMDNAVGAPQMRIDPSFEIPYPSSSYGVDGGGYSFNSVIPIFTQASPTSGTWTVVMQATVNSPATATMVFTALSPVPVNFDGRTKAVINQPAGSWRYYEITVPTGILGWDLRLRDVSGAAVPHIGVPQMVVRRDLLPDSVLNSGSWSYSGVPSAKTGWLSGNQWAAGSGESADWTGLRYDIGAPTYLVAPARLLMGMGRPLEAGTYYVGVFNNSTTTASSYTIDSRGIGEAGSGRTYEVQPSLAYAGGGATIGNLTPREARYFKVTIPANTPSWEVTLEPSAGEMELLVRRGTVPDFNAGGSGEVNNENSGQPSGDVQIEMQKAGAERYVMLPQNGQAYIPAADYYLAVVSEGVNPVNSTIGTGTSSGVLTSLGPLAVTPLGSATNEGLMQAVSLEAGQIKAFTFTVPANTNSLEVRMDNATGMPRMRIDPGLEIPYPSSSYGVDGGSSATDVSPIFTQASPTSGIWTVVMQAAVNSPATVTMVIRQLQTLPLNYAASLNGNGQSHTASRQLLDTQKDFFEVAVPTSLGGQPVIGWLINVANLQGDTTLKIYKTWGNTDNAGITVTGNSALIVPPFLTPGDTWFVEVTSSGLTNYTITSLPITLERPVWAMPLGHNTTFGDSGNDSGVATLPGDRGVDIGQDDWHFYAIEVPEGNAGLLRTDLQAINGNPNLYLREDGVPTTDHDSNGNWNGGNTLVHRSLTSTGSEYGNWVPVDGIYQKQLRSGRWYLGVKALGGTNARYRLKVSTGQVTDLALNGGAVTNQPLVGGDWRYYRFTVPADAPNSWNLTFSQEVGDVNMWLRDSIPPGADYDGLNGSWISWYSDNKNQGPYSYNGHDAAGTYAFTTPPLRPGNTYYVGFRAANDATFSFSSSTSGGSIGSFTSLAFDGGSASPTLAPGAQVTYKIVVPLDATVWKYSTTGPQGVELRIENGTPPSTTGFDVHYVGNFDGGERTQTLNYWPWLPGETYFISFVNTTASAQSVSFQSVGGENNPAQLLANATSAAGLTGDDALPDAIPFNDGVENLLKYAFNMNLAGPDIRTLLPGTGTNGLPSITVLTNAPPGTLRIEFIRRKNSGLIYIPQKSISLSSASWMPLTASPVIQSIDSNWERVIYEEPPAQIPAPACFGRVRVTLP